MIARLGALLLLIYALGFVVFGFTLGRPASPSAAVTDAAVVLTGGSCRLEHGVEVIRHGKAHRLLVAGADPAVTKKDLLPRVPGSQEWLQCCVDLGSESVDTRSNAEEAARWLTKWNFRSLRLITSDWHMPRARYEFRKVLGPRYVIVPDAVRTDASFVTLFGEYNKYLLRRIAVWADL
jgi:uncharacterized SAM-binding protein YcdF (DUF218 family)